MKTIKRDLIIGLLLLISGCMGESDRVPPYMWSISTFHGDKVVMTLPFNGSFELISIDLKTGDSCLLIENSKTDDFLPEFCRADSSLTFLQSSDSGNELVSLGLDGKLNTVLDSQHNLEVDSFSNSHPDKIFLTGSQKKQLASEKEVYFLKNGDANPKLEQITNNDKIDSGIFYSKKNDILYWNQSSNSSKPSIIASSPPFDSMDIVGRGYLFDYSNDLDAFLKSGGGIGRFGTLELWRPNAKDQTTLIDSGTKTYLIDACFTEDSQSICMLSSDGNYGVFVHCFSIENGIGKKTLVAEYRRERNSHWVPIEKGSIIPLSKCKFNSQVK